MKPMLLAALLFAQPALAQTTAVAPIEKGTALPPPSAEVANVMAPVNAMFAGLAAHDADAIRAALAPGGGATVVIDKPDGTTVTRHLSWDEFLAGIKPGTDRYAERLTDPAVETDGKVAMVWSPYVFYLNGKPDHCGTDHFDLVRDGGAWKVVNVTWSQHGDGCGG